MDSNTFCTYADKMRRAAELAARSAGCSTHDAQDVASETMISLWMLLDRLQESTCVAYAAVAARHKAFNSLRGSPMARLDDLPGCEPPGRSAPSPEERLIGEEDVGWFLQRIDSLPPTQQAILRLRQVEMLDNADIAARLGISETSVATLLSRARKTMYNAIKQRMKQ